MKVTVERAQLLKSLGHVHRVVERRNTIPILGNVLVRAENARLSLKATDLDLEVTETLAAETGTAGSADATTPRCCTPCARSRRWSPRTWRCPKRSNRSSANCRNRLQAWNCGWRTAPARRYPATDRSGAGRGGSAIVSMPRQNVGNGATHLLRWRAIRATLGSPNGPDQIQL